MNNNPISGQDVYWRAQPAVRKIILAEAEKRVQSNISRLDSLNQRLSALCALLFAGAAVSATFTTNSDKVPPLAIVLAFASSTIFAIGGVIGCVGLYSKKRLFPGEAPSWWAKEGLDTLANLDDNSASYWLAQGCEEMIASLSASVGRRARAFNAALIVGALAGSVIALAAGTATFVKRPAQRPLPLEVTVHLVQSTPNHGRPTGRR